LAIDIAFTFSTNKCEKGKMNSKKVGGQRNYIRYPHSIVIGIKLTKIGDSIGIEDIYNCELYIF
jgi:hypothetical protein